MKSRVWFQGRQICLPRGNRAYCFMTLQPVSGEINAMGRVRLAKVLQAEVCFLNDSG